MRSTTVARVRADTSELTGRERVLEATAHHPYAMLATGDEDDIQGYAADRVVAWRRGGRGRPSVNAFGDGQRAAWLLGELADRGILTGVGRLHLPRIATGTLPAQLPTGEPDHWDFRWARTPPPRQPAQDRVRRLGPDLSQQIDALLDTAFPTTFSRPGDPGVRCWYGIHDRGLLVACAADRSRGGVGSIAAVAVHPQARGRGFGAALTAAMATAMFREFPVVTLGVMVGNDPATRLYHRLGFTELTARTSVDLTGGPAHRGG